MRLACPRKLTGCCKVRMRTCTFPGFYGSLPGPRFCSMWGAQHFGWHACALLAPSHSSRLWLHLVGLWLRPGLRLGWPLTLAACAAPTTLQGTSPARCDRSQPPKAAL